MSARLENHISYAPEAIKAMMSLEVPLRNSGLEHSLLDLVVTRASQINGCAFCLHMHTSAAVKRGETPMRLFLLDGWRDSSVFTPRERAALAWTESLTRLSETGAPDADYEAMAAHFTATEQVNLTIAIGAVNSWNRLQVGFRAQHPAVPVTEPLRAAS